MFSLQLINKIENINTDLIAYAAKGKRIFATSSFQTHSIPLIHLLSKAEVAVDFYFLDTGFHFPETLTFRKEIETLLDVKFVTLRSPINKFNQRDNKGRLFFCSYSDYCCHINKVLPLEPILHSHDIWISGVRKDQSKFRKNLAVEEKGKRDTLRYHPILDWNSKDIWNYRKEYDLPVHPLENSGYLSVGCEPCTQKHIEGDRGGRWAGQNKTECGLHTTLIEK